MEENKVENNLEQDTDVVQNNQNEIAQENSKENNVDKNEIKKYIQLDKNVKNIYSTAIFLLVLMSLRLVFALACVGDIRDILALNNPQLNVIAILAIIEDVFALINCVLSIVYFVKINQLYKCIKNDKYSEDLFNVCKKLTIVFGVVFSIFFVFELVAVAVILGIYNQFGVQAPMGQSLLSVLWSVAFAALAWLNLVYIKKVKEQLKK